MFAVEFCIPNAWGFDSSCPWGSACNVGPLHIGCLAERDGANSSSKRSHGNTSRYEEATRHTTTTHIHSTINITLLSPSAAIHHFRLYHTLCPRHPGCPRVLTFHETRRGRRGEKKERIEETSCSPQAARANPALVFPTQRMSRCIARSHGAT